MDYFLMRLLFLLLPLLAQIRDHNVTVARRADNYAVYVRMVLSFIQPRDPQSGRVDVSVDTIAAMHHALTLVAHPTLFRHQEHHK